MTLLPLVGHAEAATRVLEAIDAGRLPQTVLLAGPEGVGKQRFALWVAQALVCERREQGTGNREQADPCGECGSCRRVLGLAHPDVHWFVPVPRAKAGEPDKQVEETAELLAEVMAERREQPLWTRPDGMAIHSVASARLVLRRASMKSVEGGPKVFVIGDAERLVPQESSQEAANALLKLLEEPPPQTYFVLTTADPRRVLPTIRSRSVILRVGRLTDAEVSGFLRNHLKPAPSGSALEARVSAAEGSIGQALAETGQKRKARESAEAMLEAVTKGGGAPWERALRQNPWQARGEFTEMLDALAELLSDQVRSAVATAGRQGGRAADPAPVVRAIEKVQAARDAAQGNVNPQLLLATLSDDLAEALCR
jgi:DNA polymerase-3 subunit delta'